MARKFTAVPPTIWSAKRDGEERVHEGQQPAGQRRDQDAEEPRVELVGSEHAEERTGKHHPLEADVHDAAAFGEHAADRAEGERGREDQHRGDERGAEDDVQVGGARVRGQDSERRPEHA
jgi:hypothetical protein